jgi:hypothetical protein
MNTNYLNNSFWAFCLLAGQTVELASTFFWNDEGRHTATGAVLVILGMVFWVVGFFRLFEWFRLSHPWYFRVGLLYAVYGCLGGIAFGFEGLYSFIYDIPKVGVDAYQRLPVHMNLVLFWAGPAFPISLMVMAFFLRRLNIFPSYVSWLLFAGGIFFPISRISRNELAAHAADVLLLIPIIIISLHLINEKANPHRDVE